MDSAIQNHTTLEVSAPDKAKLKEKSSEIASYCSNEQSFFAEPMAKAFSELKFSNEPFSLCFHLEKPLFLSSVPNIGQIAIQLKGDVIPAYSRKGKELISLRNDQFKSPVEILRITKSTFVHRVWEKAEYETHPLFFESKTIEIDANIEPSPSIHTKDRVREISDAELHQIHTSASDEQNELLRSTPKQNLIITGIPGSGKTSTALERIAFLCDSKAAEENKFEKLTPRGILVLAKDSHLMNRLSYTLSQQFRVEGVEVNEISEWIVQLIRPYCRAADKSIRFNLNNFPFNIDEEFDIQDETLERYMSKELESLKENIIDFTGRILRLKDLADEALKILAPYTPKPLLQDQSIIKLQEYLTNQLGYPKNEVEFSTQEIKSETDNTVIKDVILKLGRIISYSSRIDNDRHHKRFKAWAKYNSINEENLKIADILTYNSLILNLSDQKCWDTKVKDGIRVTGNIEKCIKSLIPHSVSNRARLFQLLNSITNGVLNPKTNKKSTNINSLNQSWKTQLKKLSKVNPARLVIQQNSGLKIWDWQNIFEVVKLSLKLNNTMKNLGIEEIIKAKYKHVFIDEFQLYNPKLINLVLKISNVESFTFSGDPEQGSGLQARYTDENFEISNKFSNYRTVKLLAGYRWTIQVLEYLKKSSQRLDLPYSDYLASPNNVLLSYGPEVIEKQNLETYSITQEICEAYDNYDVHLNHSHIVVAPDLDIAHDIADNLKQLGILTINSFVGEEVKVDPHKITIASPNNVIGLEFDHVYIIDPSAIISIFDKNVLWTCLTRARISMRVYGNFE